MGSLTKGSATFGCVHFLKLNRRRQELALYYITGYLNVPQPVFTLEISIESMDIVSA